MKCPGCGYERRKTDNAPDWQCPSCEIAYNKHPNYKTSNEYELQLTYKLIPVDEEIKPNIIYLYLNSENSLEYALIDENGEIKRLRLFDSELNGHSTIIARVLKNSGTSLDKEQEQILFSAFSKKGYQKSPDQHADNKLEYYSLVKRKNTKRRKIILGCFLVASIGALFFTYSPTPTPAKKSSANTPEVLKNKNQQKEPVKKSISVKAVNLQARGINLSFISSKLYVVNALVKECRAMCQAHRKVDSSCDKANEIMKEIYPKVNLYKDYFRRHDINELQGQDQKMALEINQYLEDIPKEMETAKNLCQRPAIQEPKAKKIDFNSKGINLSILYSKIYTADNQIRNCRLHCEAGSRTDTGCSIFISLEKEYRSELEKLFRIMDQYSLTIHSEELSIEDKNYIRQIFDLLDDIGKERKKIIKCVDSLKYKRR
ncbi:hypothetical protein E3983_10230 [Legionella israelensis]|uniref:Uncharacterized protein n=1 Tax=Legionella israelensis TaxID=454 RepID=A0AAX1EHZ6_9GAMM|nr:hypothetical protein [Legionella israelensis]QBR84708.1 hypothetical protein E3983_10230 [Legionella israelensis]